MDIAEAGQALDGYRQRSEQLDAERDQLIRDARAAGMNIRQIHLRSGIGRSTIYRVLGPGAEGENGPPVLQELRDNADSAAYWQDWYCDVPLAEASYVVVREEWFGTRQGHPVRSIFEIRLQEEGGES